jgi:thiol-disulfide isomerase/thioredoxin
MARRDPASPNVKEHPVKTRTLSVSLAATAALGLFAGTASTALAHPDGADGHAHTINVEPVRSAEAAETVLDRERAQMEMPKLLVGSEAPKLQIAEWVKGDSVNGFEKGETYIVEFWATWCGPCIRAFPHISELQARHKDDLTVIGVNIWDRKQDRTTGEFTEPMDEFVKRIDTFVEGKGDDMGYTVAIEESGKMAESWMRAAGRNGIPSAFIVDGEGKIAWAGHPMMIDEPLNNVLAGTHDLEAAKSAQVAELEQNMWLPHTMGLLGDEATAERGYELAYALIRTPFANNARALNQMSWAMLTSDKVAVRDHKAAIALAAVAAEKTKWEDASVIDTLARGYYESGNVGKAVDLQQKAIAVQEKAIENAPKIATASPTSACSRA